MTAGFDLAAALKSGAPVIDVPVGRYPAMSLTIDRAVTLRGGPGVVLEGHGTQGGFRIDVPGGLVAIEGITFEACDAHAGGALHLAQGSLAVEGCMFHRGTAHRFGGGAIYAAGTSLSIRHCQFLENLGRQGGAILLDDEVEAILSDSELSGNGAVQGGAIRLREGASLRIERCTFSDNRAVPKEGATAEGHTFYVSGTTSRAPRLVVDHATIVSLTPGQASELYNDREVGGAVSFHDCALPEAMRGLGDATCRYGAQSR